MHINRTTAPNAHMNVYCSSSFMHFKRNVKLFSKIHKMHTAKIFHAREDFEYLYARCIIWISLPTLSIIFSKRYKTYHQPLALVTGCYCLFSITEKWNKPFVCRDDTVAMRTKRHDSHPSKDDYRQVELPSWQHLSVSVKRKPDCLHCYKARILCTF